jgi:hypothetical protein
MNTTFAELKMKVIRCLSDEAEVVDYAPLGGATYSADLLKDGIHAALDAITSRLWKPNTFEVEAAVDTSTLPDDLIDVESVYEKELGLFIPKISMKVGSSLSSTTGNGWLLYPNGTLTFVNDVGSSGCTVHYSARWAKPEDDGDLLEPPASCLTCLILFAASYCLLSDATSSASIDRFKTKVDSGQPTDNPAKEMSNFMLHRFEVELQRLPMMEKGRVQ